MSTPEANLKALAALYNKKYLFVHYPNWMSSHFNTVNIVVIGVQRDEQHSIPHKEHYDVIIRVSALKHAQHASGNNVIVEEVKWEGKLQDWYRACAEAVENVSNNQFGG